MPRSFAAAAHRTEGLGEDDLEVGELGVDVVVGLGADLLGLLAGLAQDAVGLVLGTAGDLGVGDQGAALGVRVLDDPLGLQAGPLDHVVTVADQFPCLGEGVGQGRAQFVEQGEQLGAVDHARGRHGHGSGARDHRDDLVELLLHVHRVVHRVLATLYDCVENGRVDCTASGGPASAQSCFRRSPRASRTSGGTRWETSPPQVATSLTREDDRKL